MQRTASAHRAKRERRDPRAAGSQVHDVHRSYGAASGGWTEFFQGVANWLFFWR